MNKEAVKIPVLVPLLATQTVIVDGLQAEQALVDTNIECVERFENKTQKTIGRVWEEEP